MPLRIRAHIAYPPRIVAPVGVPSYERHMYSTKGPAWTNIDDDNLRKWWGNRSINRIALYMGRCPKTIKRQAVRLGLKK